MVGDAIDLAGITASSATYSGSTLTIDETNGQQLIYSNVNGSLAGDAVTVASDNNGGTDVYWTSTPPPPVVNPTISGTVSGQMTSSETPLRPFAGVIIGDANANATDTLTIALDGAGGTLSGTGLSGGSGGSYALSGTAAAITIELDALVFTPTAGAPDTSSSTTFTLSDLSSAGGAPAVDDTTSVTDIDPAVAPTIVGTESGQATASEIAVKPFAHATIGDRNAGAADTLTITLGGSGGTLAGTGLSGGLGGVYTLSGTAAAITTELDALVFTPNAAWPNVSATTTFALSDVSSAGGGAPAVDFDDDSDRQRSVRRHFGFGGLSRGQHRRHQRGFPGEFDHADQLRDSAAQPVGRAGAERYERDHQDHERDLRASRAGDGADFLCRRQWP